MDNCYYKSSIAEFLRNGTDGVLGRFNNQHQTETDFSYRQTVEHLQETLKNYEGFIALEFKIPRIGKRADAILIMNGLIFILEYKTGKTSNKSNAANQCMDYALDLKNFHSESHNAHIIPVVVDERSNSNHSNTYAIKRNKIATPLYANFENLSSILDSCLKKWDPQELDANKWIKSAYKPTPTIIESAVYLYKNHNVKDISRSDANKQNLTETCDTVQSIIQNSRNKNQKSIVFITGVPGAGKTLAGLNIASLYQQKFDQSAVFLSGNGPLVAVLKEALKRDNKKNSQIDNNSIQAFIQNIHHFRDEGLQNHTPPHEKIAIFDEAQRAWNEKTTSNFMQRTKRQKDFNKSEPEFLIEMMDRHNDWAVIVCLIGGGQEINKGESGLSDWFEAIKKNFLHWNVYVSGELAEHNEYQFDENFNISNAIKNVGGNEINSLHLSVSMRSFRAENQSKFIQAILDKNIEEAQNNYENLSDDYPIYVTRNKIAMQNWLQDKKLGTERIGIMAHSNAIRLFPDGIYVKNNITPEHWFLNDGQDVRSSQYLEYVATEFDIQGLELDWTGVCWDINLFPSDEGWNYKEFRGTKWQKIQAKERQKYLKNAYRVLLTRARQGMITYIPMGDKKDHTRPPEEYQAIYDYLKECGIRDLPNDN